MKKLLFIVFALVTVFTASAQEKKKPVDFMTRAGDHLMLQSTYDIWTGTPDSIKSHLQGFHRGINVYVMLDKRFKSSPKFSVALGLGISTSNMYFDKMVVDIKSKTTTLPFISVDTVDHFKKYKLTTAHIEIPLELRFALNPENESRSFKTAVGFKVGTRLSEHTKGKTLVNKNGTVLNEYTAKETGKRFFNSIRWAATARIGYGNFTLIGSWQLNNIFKNGVAADIKLFQFGLNLSGL
jgi:Outer membrane protein beta-barrel domain